MNTPSKDYHRTDFLVPDKLLSGADAWAHGVVGAYQRRSGVLAELEQFAAGVDAQAGHWSRLTDHHLQEKLSEFREEFRRRRRGKPLRVAEALAAVREAAERKVGLRPFHVQLMGALALHRGCLAEMATGEGKTLTAGLAAVLAGWTGLPCHIVTANDYLVQRDAEWLRPLYHFCGLKAGVVIGEMKPPQRRQGYDQDITYTTSKELVADFLRDRLQLGAWQNASRRLIHTLLNPTHLQRAELVMRGLHTAIVDEADSLLIDEAVTPLIISAPLKNELLREVCRQAEASVADLKPGFDYRIDLQHREIELTPPGKEKIIARSNQLAGLFRSLNRRVELVLQALVAREFFLRGKQYVLVDGKVVIVDEYTGRMMQQRTWRAGLQQAIEDKEGLEITDPTETLARLSFQRFFRLFRKISGMTGTARETSAELWQIYRLPVISIPTNRPCLRTQLPDKIFSTAEQKWRAVADDICELHASGRPILIGTRSISASERLAELLSERGVEFQLLNALRHLEEARIVAEAGHRGRITIATNMAGRGTDIRLGQGVAAAGGLHVVATERHDARRIDRQLFGRSARQGDPGSAQAYISMEDELLQRYCPPILRRSALAMVRANRPGCRQLAGLLISLAQQRAEHHTFRQRKALLRMDTWLEEALSFAGPDIG